MSELQRYFEGSRSVRKLLAYSLGAASVAVSLGVTSGFLLHKLDERSKRLETEWAAKQLDNIYGSEDKCLQNTKWDPIDSAAAKPLVWIEHEDDKRILWVEPAESEGIAPPISFVVLEDGALMHASNYTGVVLTREGCFPKSWDEMGDGNQW